MTTSIHLNLRRVDCLKKYVNVLQLVSQLRTFWRFLKIKFRKQKSIIKLQKSVNDMPESMVQNSYQLLQEINWAVQVEINSCWSEYGVFYKILNKENTLFFVPNKKIFTQENE